MNAQKFMPVAIVVALALFALAPSARADLSSANVIDPLIQQFEQASHGWAIAITAAANNLFWILASVSLVLSLGFLALTGASLGELMAAVVRFILLTGVSVWLLNHGPEFSHDIIRSFTEIGTKAAGTGTAFYPTQFLDVAFSLYKKILANEPWYNPAAAVNAEVIGILLVLSACWMTTNIILVLCSSWVLSAAGVVFLAFGASIWGRDIAFGFWRLVIAVGVRLMVMVLVTNLGYQFLQQTAALLTVSPNGGELIVMLAASVVLALLSHSLPNLVASAVGGYGAHGIGNLGANFGVGAVMGAGAMLLREADRVNNRSEKTDTRLQQAIQAAQATMANGNAQGGGPAAGGATPSPNGNTPTVAQGTGTNANTVNNPRAGKVGP